MRECIPLYFLFYITAISGILWTEIWDIKVTVFTGMRQEAMSEKIKTLVHHLFVMIHHANAFYLSKESTKWSLPILQPIILKSADSKVPCKDTIGEAVPKKRWSLSICGDDAQGTAESSTCTVTGYTYMYMYINVHCCTDTRRHWQHSHLYPMQLHF